MTAWRCREVEAGLIDSIDGRLDSAASVRLHAHIESCAACRERATLWRDLTPALRALEPAPPQPMATRRMQIEVERQLTNWTVAAPRRRWRWMWASTVSSVAGAAVVLLLLFHRAPPPPATSPDGYATLARLTGTLTIDSRALGPSTVVPVGRTLALASGAEAELAMDRGTIVHIAGPAHLALTGTASTVTVRLDDGSLTATVAHRLSDETFAVVTSDLRVEVRGTRFSVIKGSSGSQVHVDEGMVLVGFVDGRRRFVSAGQSASSVESSDAPMAPAAVVVPTIDAPPVERLTCSTTVRACRETTNVVRSSMRHGDPARALRMISERGRTALDARCGGEELGACQDELRYLRAEALNQAGQLDDAITAYRALDRRTSPPAMRQNALYAAAQIERRRGHNDDARADYERALGAAPRGALRQEILIGAMETAQVSGDPGSAGALARRYLVEFPNGLAAGTARRLAGSQR